MPPAKKPRQVKPSKKNLWIRNLHYVSARITFENSSGRRVELTPRGQRGDSAPLQEGEEIDDRFILNQGLLFEVITAEEASEVVGKQTTNQQARHPSFKSIRNELGEEYDDDEIKITKPFEQQSYAVAELENGEVAIDRGVGIRRAKVPGSADHQLPEIPLSIDAHEQSEYLAEQRAEHQKRAIKAQSAKDVLPGGVSMDPPTKS